MFRAVFHYCGALWSFFIDFFGVVVGDPGIEPGVRLREGVTVPCHTLRPVAHCSLERAHCLVQGEKHKVNLKFITRPNEFILHQKNDVFVGIIRLMPRED